MKLITAIITLLACALLVIWLAGCGEEREDILHPRVPTLYLTEHDIHTDDFVYFITASEPLPYPISLIVTITVTIPEADDFVKVLVKLNVTLNRGSHAWYGFYAGRYLPGDSVSGVVLFDWAHGKLKCIGIRSTNTGSFRSVERKDVSEITVTISHPTDDDGDCLIGSYVYNIGASEITITK